MDRSIFVEVDRASWPAVGPPSYPGTFPAASQAIDFNIPALLLTIGFLTTPSHASGISLSEYWAYVRYLNAVSTDADLRLTRDFADLDAHQKTILSDDFGMGVPIYWLLQRLPLTELCDGRYFIERVAASTGAVAVKTGKRGPNKSPDFVIKDANGDWHIVECKGTQSGTTYRDKQLGSLGPPLTGARAQKRTITFPVGHTGQRLACALTIGVENGTERSILKIVDPEPEVKFEVSDGDVPAADDAALRSTAARGLRLAGFAASSLAVSAPAGSSPMSRQLSGRAEQRRREQVERKEQVAQSELDRRTDRSLFQFSGERYRGREIKLDLPSPVDIGGKTANGLRIRQGVQDRVLSDLRQRVAVEGLLREAGGPWNDVAGIVKLEYDNRSAVLKIGDFFLSELVLS